MMTMVGAHGGSWGRRPPVPKSVSKSRFKPRSLAYLPEVEETGKALILTDRGRPVLRIEPHAPAAEALAALRGCVVRYDAATEPVAVDDWEAGA